MHFYFERSYIFIGSFSSIFWGSSFKLFFFILDLFFQIELFVYFNDNILWTLVAFQGFYSLLPFFLNIICNHVLLKEKNFADLSATLSNIHFVGKVLIDL